MGYSHSTTKPCLSLRKPFSFAITWNIFKGGRTSANRIGSCVCGFFFCLTMASVGGFSPTSKKITTGDTSTESSNQQSSLLNIYTSTEGKSKNNFFTEMGKFSFSTLQPNTALCGSLEAEAPSSNSFSKSSYFSLDQYEQMKAPERLMADSHAIFGSLNGKNMIHRYDVYRRIRTKPINEVNNTEIVFADVEFGKNLDGHPGIVHGGIISLLFDDCFGWGTEAALSSLGYSTEAASEIDLVVTANLNVDFRKPLPSGTRVAIRLYLVKQEGRKMYLRAKMESLDGSVLYSEATSLYILVMKKSV